MKKKLIPKIVSYEEFEKALEEVGGEKATKAKYEQYKIEMRLIAEGKDFYDEEKEYGENFMKNGKGTEDKLLDLETLIYEIIGWCACSNKRITDDFVEGYLAAIEQRFFGGMREYNRTKAKRILNEWIEK